MNTQENGNEKKITVMADLHYLMEYAQLLKSRIDVDVLTTADVGYAGRMAELAERVRWYVITETTIR